MKIDMHPQAQGTEKLQESRDAPARLDAWTACKAQWRIGRASGKAGGVRKPKQSDRPEISARATPLAR